MGASVPAWAADELRLAARAAQLDVARAYAYEAAAAFGLDDDGCREFVFAVNEAVTNAIKHGAPDEQGQIQLTAVADGEFLTLSVRDYGTFRSADIYPAPGMESGRGLALMLCLMDAVQLSVAPGSTTVSLSKSR